MALNGGGGYFLNIANPRQRVRVPLAEWPDELLCQQADAYGRVIEQRQGGIIHPRGSYLEEEWCDYESITEAKCHNEDEIVRMMEMRRRIRVEIERMNTARR